MITQRLLKMEVIMKNSCAVLMHNIIEIRGKYSIATDTNRLLDILCISRVPG